MTRKLLGLTILAGVACCGAMALLAWFPRPGTAEGAEGANLYDRAV